VILDFSIIGSQQAQYVSVIAGFVEMGVILLYYSRQKMGHLPSISIK